MPQRMCRAWYNGSYTIVAKSMKTVVNSIIQ